MQTASTCFSQMSTKQIALPLPAANRHVIWAKTGFDLLWLNLPNVIYNKILVNVMLTLPTLNLHWNRVFSRKLVLRPWPLWCHHPLWENPRDPERGSQYYKSIDPQNCKVEIWKEYQITTRVKSEYSGSCHFRGRWWNVQEQWWWGNMTRLYWARYAP